MSDKKTNGSEGSNSETKSKFVTDKEKQVAIGLWIQVIGQFVELNGLSDLYRVYNNGITSGEGTVLAGVWIKSMGQLAEAISVSEQLNETDKQRLIEHQKLALFGDSLVLIGSVFEVIGDIELLKEEFTDGSFLIP